MFSIESFVNSVLERGIPLHAVMVAKGDEIIASWRAGEKQPYNVFSIAKSFLSIGIGMAIDEGLLGITDRPVDAFAELVPDSLDPRWERVTLHNLLTMTTGHGRPYLMAAERKALRGLVPGDFDDSMKKEWMRFAFSCPIVEEPGYKFSYGNQCTYMAGRMLERATGVTVREYVYDKLWRYLGTPMPKWDEDPGGHTFTPSDLYLDVLDMTKFGVMCLQNGNYDGRQLVSREWLGMATSKRVDCVPISKNPMAADERMGYGYGFWQNTREGYRAYGRESQFILVLPEKQAVVAIQADYSNVQEVLDLFWEYVYQQFLRNNP